MKHTIKNTANSKHSFSQAPFTSSVSGSGYIKKSKTAIRAPSMNATLSVLEFNLSNWLTFQPGLSYESFCVVTLKGR